MNENLAYWQLDFTVESKSGPRLHGYAGKIKSLRGPRRPPNTRPTLLLGLWPSAIHYFQIFSSKPGLIPV